MRGLKEQLQKQLIEVQNSRTGVVVDQWLRIKGTAGGLGDLHLPGEGVHERSSPALPQWLCMFTRALHRRQHSNSCNSCFGPGAQLQAPSLRWAMQR